MTGVLSIFPVILGGLITPSMSLPSWVEKFKEPKTHIRKIKSVFYKYAIEYQYNPKTKRTDKITKHLLGKITEKQGFIPSEKGALQQQIKQIPRVDIKTYGIYHLFTSLLADDLQSLHHLFTAQVSEILLTIALMRFAYQHPLKRIPYQHAHDFCSQHWASSGLDDKKITAALRYAGENRNTLVEWMQSRMKVKQEGWKHFVLIDSTHIPTLSESLHLNEVGYNPQRSYDPQVRLMYIFSAQIKQPVYYRLIQGNIMDVTSMKTCVKELGVENVIFIADKGFYSQGNATDLQKNNLHYIIPLYRNNSLIDYQPLLQANFKKGIKNYFTYQNRIIWYYAYPSGTEQVVTYLDERLRVEEENDYLNRIRTHPDKYSEEEFYEKMHQLGTLTLSSFLPEELPAQELFEAYKQRNEIEMMFDTYKNFLEADRTYMQNRYVLEGWLMTNFIAMIAYYRLYQRLQEAKLLSKYSPKDILEISKGIYQTKISENWQCSEITKKIKTLFEKIKIEYRDETELKTNC